MRSTDGDRVTVKLTGIPGNQELKLSMLLTNAIKWDWGLSEGAGLVDGIEINYRWDERHHLTYRTGRSKGFSVTADLDGATNQDRSPILVYLNTPHTDGAHFAYVNGDVELHFDAPGVLTTLGIVGMVAYVGENGIATAKQYFNWEKDCSGPLPPMSISHVLSAILYPVEHEHFRGGLCRGIST